MLGNLRLLPKFNERVPEARKWPEAALTLMLQCALTGRAQEAYSALSFTDSQSYELAKLAVLKGYEPVLEAYRQCVRMWRKAEKQTLLFELAQCFSVHH